MLDIGVCPHCYAPVGNLKLEPIDVLSELTQKYTGITMLCPFCTKLLRADWISLPKIVAEIRPPPKSVSIQLRATDIPQYHTPKASGSS